MSTQREALQQALEALEIAKKLLEEYDEMTRDIATIRAALEQPEQEPEPVDAEAALRLALAQRDWAFKQLRREWRSLSEKEVKYPHPPAKPPVYATSQNTKAVRDGFEMGGYEKEPGYYSEEQLDDFARAVEAKLKELNHE